MQSFSRGWSFLTQAWGMAFKDKDLIKPSIYALLVGFFVSILGIIPIVGAYLLFGDSGFGQALTFALGALIFFVFVLVASLISSYTGIAYHTCLYIWAREAERAQALGQPIQVTAPAPLAAVLG